MKLSSKSQYGLKACYVLALNHEKKSFSASALEKEIGVSAKYLERILRMLSGEGIISAERGVAGGYRLATSPENITVGDVTFRYSEKGIPQSLCKAEKLYYVTTAGGYIGENNFGFDYIKAVASGFFSIGDIEFFSAEGLDIYGADVNGIMQKAKEDILL